MSLVIARSSCTTADNLAANYVELIEDGEESAPPAPAHEEPEAEEEAAPEPAAASDGPSATALYDYAADEEGELSEFR